MNGAGTVGGEQNRLAATGTAGVALANATGPLLMASTPNDGNTHLVTVAMKMVVTSTETGGAIGISIIESGGTADNQAAFAAGLSAGTFHWPGTGFVSVLVGPNCAIAVNQTSALTGGASTVQAEIWSS